ncbi:MAG TPA: Druantia anti-phage system protein DruA, partial [Anaerolineales bacterium]
INHKPNHKPNHEVFTADPPLDLLKSLKVRALEPHEYGRAGELLDREHYLGDVPQGRQLLQVVEYNGQWVALLDWGPATLKLADREEWIGWTAQQRAERLGLVALKRRFLVLGKTRMPNLASRSLALALKALPEHWEQAHGCKPLLAETFSDIEQYEGTCYKASNWIACGRTKGFARHRIDYYRKHDRPKKLWLKTLNRNTRRILTAMDLPPAYRKALNTGTPERDLPLKKDQIESLGEFLRKNFPDPRRANRSFPCWSLLAFIAMALLAGRDNLAAIQRYSRFLTQQQRRWLRFPLIKGSTTFRKVPSYTALRNLLVQIGPHQLADCLNGWLGASLGTLPRALAVDGKWIRDRALSLCLSEHETGAPAAMGFAKEKTKRDDEQSKDNYKREGEQSVALRLYATTHLENATVTGDALNNNQAQARAVLEGGGDYFFQLKNEKRHAYKAAVQKAKGAPLLPTPKSPTPTTDAATGAR